MTRNHRRVRSESHSAKSPFARRRRLQELDAYDLAVLGGGRERAVNAALVALDQAGAIESGAETYPRLVTAGVLEPTEMVKRPPSEFKGGSCLRAVGEVEPGVHPVERAVLRAVVATPVPPDDVATVRSSAIIDPILVGLEERLVAAGLRWSDADRRHRTRLLQITLAMAVLVPVGWLSFATNSPEGMIYGLLGAAELALVAGGTRTNLTTRAGWLAVKRAQIAHPLRTAHPLGVRQPDLALEVAVHGEYVLWTADRALALALKVQRRSPGGGGYAGGESYGDVGGDDGCED